MRLDPRRALQIVAETDGAVVAPHGMYPAGHDPTGTDGLYRNSEGASEDAAHQDQDLGGWTSHGR
jgi:hypothetical protein